MKHLILYTEKITVYLVALNMCCCLRRREQFLQANDGTLTQAQSPNRFRMKSAFKNVRLFITQHSLAPEMLHKPWWALHQETGKINFASDPKYRI
jgi:hypothetical protein